MTYVLDFQEVGLTQIALVGGKGAHLGELSRIEGVRVPAGFCVTTAAFERITADLPALPDDVAAEITDALARLGEHVPYAVRSSATAEDSLTASFAGQHDSYLNVVGPAAILEQIRRCWASLFTERAVAYRRRHGFDHGNVRMAVVVQQMVTPQAAGVLFTADPVTGHRKVACVEASSGLGEALVSGRVNADAYRVRDGQIIARTIDPARRGRPAVTDAQVVALAQLGRRIEAHLGRPQDLEWCLADDEFHIVQSRPITTLFPIPGTDDGENHVYVSVGHQQMMTDAMTPLGLSLFQLTAGRPMYEAGGRLFVDVTLGLASPASRAALLQMMQRSEPLVADALQTVVDRGDFLRSLPDRPVAAARAPASLAPDPAIVAELIERNDASVQALQREIRATSGPALLELIRADLQELKRLLHDPRSHQVFMTAIEATWWLDDQLYAWLGERNAADPLARSAPGNVTSEMGLALLDVADVIRPYPEVVAYLQRTEDDGVLDALPALAGGREARDAIAGYLDKYGMRCAGEIDIARPRWTERPRALVPLLLGHLERFEPGAGQRRFAQGQRESARRARELLDRVRALPDGAQRADEVAQKIDQLRAFIGYREYPKYGMIRRYFVYKQALLAEAERLVQRGVLRAANDVFFLSFPELEDVVRTGHAEDAVIRDRRAALPSYQALTPPRVITSDGEVITGAYRRGELPAGALVGLPVSAGIVEGRARVVRDMAAAELEAGDILVTTYTDPSWTPLFVAIAGLVTEVGGLMTHGAVIAREYGLPAVVGVPGATQRIRDGQRIRVHGTDGYVELEPR